MSLLCKRLFHHTSLIVVGWWILADGLWKENGSKHVFCCCCCCNFPLTRSAWCVWRDITLLAILETILQLIPSLVLPLSRSREHWLSLGLLVNNYLPKHSSAVLSVRLFYCSQSSPSLVVNIKRVLCQPFHAAVPPTAPVPSSQAGVRPYSHLSTLASVLNTRRSNTTSLSGNLPPTFDSEPTSCLRGHECVSCTQRIQTNKKPQLYCVVVAHILDKAKTWLPILSFLILFQHVFLLFTYILPIDVQWHGFPNYSHTMAPNHSLFLKFSVATKHKSIAKQLTDNQTYISHSLAISEFKKKNTLCGEIWSFQSKIKWKTFLYKNVTAKM